MGQSKHPLISVVILNYNGRGISEPCVESVLNSDYPEFEVVVVDNASNDGSAEEIEQRFGNDKRLRLVRSPVNLFYTGGNNIGIRESKGEYIFVINNDTEIDRDCLSRISSAMRDERIGAAQPKILLYGRDSVIDNTGGLIDRLGYTKGRGSKEKDAGQYDGRPGIFFAGGTAIVLKKKVLGEVGVFDDKFVAHWEDVDLSWRIRLKGYKIVFIPEALIHHKVSQSIKKLSANEVVSFHIRKNRIAGLIKNYGLVNMLRYLPMLLLVYIFVFIKEALMDRKIKMALSSIYAIAWNLKELPCLLKKRRVVQNTIRAVPDREILAHFLDTSLVLEQFLKLKNG